MPSHPSSRRTAWMASAGLVSWLGEVVHNRMELPQLTLLSPENLVPLLITVILVAAWRVGSRRVGAWGLLGWGILHLVVGAVLTVLPLPILPFTPEQSLTHYMAHVAYGVAQVPLVWFAWREVQRDVSVGAGPGSA